MWTWSGPHRRPLPCHEITETVSLCWLSTYEPAESAKAAKIAVSCYQIATKIVATKLLPRVLVGEGADRGGSVPYL